MCADSPATVPPAPAAAAPPAPGTPTAGPASATPAAPAPSAAPAGEDRLVAAYRAYLTGHPDPPGGTLLGQTTAMGPVRQAVVPLIPLRAGWRVLDLGTGFGPLAFELAHRQPVQVTAVDRDPGVLAAAREIAGVLGGWLADGSSVELVEGSAEALPIDDASVDLVTASLLFQHVAGPARVAGEMWRVLAPGGVAFAFDVDDGLGASYPDNGPLARLDAAFAEWQGSYGGDRRIGRKLSVLFADQGFAIARVYALPQAQHVTTRPGDPTRVATAARLRAARQGIVGGGILDGQTFDGLLDQYERAPARSMCQIETRIAVVAVKPAGPDHRVPPPAQ